MKNLAYSVEELKAMFDYNNGYLYWKVKISDKITPGKKAGSRSGKYEIIKINKQNYYTHRLVFFIHYGFMPETIDHIDNNPRNNKIENLREASYSENLRNTTKKTKALSRFKGVTFSKKDNKWVSRIKLIDKRITLGYFDNETDAAKAYDIAAIKYFGNFANTNRGKYND